MDRETYNDPDISNAELVNRDTFERLQAKKRFKKVVRRINYILLSIVLCFCFVIICMAAFLKIDHIEVTGNSRYTSDEIVEVSGISVGQNLYAIDKKEARRFITLEYPYINEVIIRRTLPSTLTFKIGEEDPRYYTEIFGEYFILSQSLRILERTSEFDEDNTSLVLLKLPVVKKAIVGNAVEFDKELTFGYISEFIDRVENNGMASRLTEIDISNKYNIYVNCEDRFRIYLGDNTDTDMKLTFAGLMIDNFEPDQKGTVDAHDITVGSVILDN